MIDAILACLDQCGPSHVSLWTWTVAEYEVQCMERLMADGRLLSARLVIDKGARAKNMAIILKWQSLFGADSVRYVTNHAKIATIRSDNYKLLLRGSMNLNYNPRFEQFDITEGGADYDLVAEIENELPVLSNNCSNGEATAASKVSNAFEPDQIAFFSNVKVWNK